MSMLLHALAAAALSQAPADAPADAAVEEIAPVAATPAPTARSAGTLTFGGAIRGRYDLRFDDADASGQPRRSSHLSFDTVILRADYDSPTWFAAGQYRFYGGNFMYRQAYGYENYPGEVSFPVYAYAGRKFGAGDKVTVGLQPVPFDDQYWGSAFLNSMGFAIGLEEVYNLGVAYEHAGRNWTVQAGYFPTTAPNAFGISDDSARYSVNVTGAGVSAPSSSRNEERDMVAGRVQRRLSTASGTQLAFSASAWLSTIRNLDTREDGSRRAYALSVKATNGPYHAKALVARQSFDLRDTGSRDVLSVGDYDSAYSIAARGDLVFAEVGRELALTALPFKASLYGSYARFMKDAAGFKDSERFNLGVFWTDKTAGRIKVWSEVLVGRNDPYVGAGQFATGAAQGGDDRWKTSALVIFGYYF
ncbi:hypothetical protein DDF62_23840 [Caulobacter radicis]|uniref:hypothetical protein n=1 Tax=Caulobacter radicis TaxID=2172650 RepID=UPI000D57667A|nr:hypothetical protein [Caulobacter radicis]PVM84036.1 hypothetical protein DDF62_23840 [Caulobacter radicis]